MLSSSNPLLVHFNLVADLPNQLSGCCDANPSYVYGTLPPFHPTDIDIDPPPAEVSICAFEEGLQAPSFNLQLLEIELMGDRVADPLN